jgi:thiaminase/transcriptional activator TenA
MALHRDYAARCAISEAELQAAQPTAATHAYTRHLLHVAHSGTLGELAAAILPCQWSYAELGRLLDRSAPRPLHPLYGEWISAYASSEFGALARWLRAVVDRCAVSAGPPERDRMRQHFVDSSRYEVWFWESALHRTEWPA